MRIAGRSVVAAASVGIATWLAAGPPVAGQVPEPVRRIAATQPAGSRPVLRQVLATGPAAQPAPTSRPAYVLAARTQPASTQPSMIRIDNPKYDFGKVWDTEGVSHTFELVNTGDRVLNITGVHATCGCTTTDKWAKQVPPGQTWQLLVKFDTTGRRGKTSKTVQVTTDDPAARQVVFTLEGEITPRFDMPPTVSFGVLQQDAVAKRTVSITNNGEEPVRLSNANVDLSFLKVDLKEVEAGRKYELTVETVPPLNMTSIRGKITIQTDMKDTPEIALWASAYIQPRISLMPRVVMVQQPLDREFRRRLVLKSAEAVRFHVKEATASNPAIQVSVETVREGQEYSVWLTIPAGHALPAAGETVTINTDDAQMPALTVSVRAFVSPPRTLAMGAASTQRIQRPLATQPGEQAVSTRPVARPAFVPPASAQPPMPAAAAPTTQP